MASLKGKKFFFIHRFQYMFLLLQSYGIGLSTLDEEHIRSSEDREFYDEENFVSLLVHEASILSFVDVAMSKLSETISSLRWNEQKKEDVLRIIKQVYIDLDANSFRFVGAEIRLNDVMTYESYVDEHYDQCKKDWSHYHHLFILKRLGI